MYLVFYNLADIDECAEDSDGCSQNCHNTLGSYTCSCNAGYRLNTDGHACDGKLRLLLDSTVFLISIDDKNLIIGARIVIALTYTFELLYLRY